MNPTKGAPAVTDNICLSLLYINISKYIKRVGERERDWGRVPCKHVNGS